jgi:hypothetical protein
VLLGAGVFKRGKAEAGCIVLFGKLDALLTTASTRLKCAITRGSAFTAFQFPTTATTRLRIALNSGACKQLSVLPASCSELR